MGLGMIEATIIGQMRKVRLKKEERSSFPAQATICHWEGNPLGLRALTRVSGRSWPRPKVVSGLSGNPGGWSALLGLSSVELATPREAVI